MDSFFSFLFKNLLLVLLTLLSLHFFSSCSKEDPADNFVGTYFVRAVGNVVWGNSSGVVTDSGYLSISKVSADRVQTDGFLSVSGNVSGNTVYFESTFETKGNAYLTTTFEPATKKSDVFYLSCEITGQLPSGGRLYPYNEKTKMTLKRK